MKCALMAAIAIGSLQAVYLNFDKETEQALSQQASNKWFEDEVHDDDYNPNDIDNMVRDKSHVQLSDGNI